MRFCPPGLAAGPYLRLFPLFPLIFKGEGGRCCHPHRQPQAATPTPQKLPEILLQTTSFYLILHHSTLFALSGGGRGKLSSWIPTGPLQAFIGTKSSQFSRISSQITRLNPRQPGLTRLNPPTKIFLFFLRTSNSPKNSTTSPLHHLSRKNRGKPLSTNLIRNPKSEIRNEKSAEFLTKAALPISPSPSVAFRRFRSTHHSMTPISMRVHLDTATDRRFSPSPREARTGRGLGRGALLKRSDCNIISPLPDPLPTPSSWGEGIGDLAVNVAVSRCTLSMPLPENKFAHRYKTRFNMDFKWQIQS
jgi:hypothetical protein